MVNVLRFDTDTYTCCLVSIFSPETSVAHMWKGLSIYLRLFRGGGDHFLQECRSRLLYFCLFLFCFFGYQKYSGVFSPCTVRVWKGAKFHARMFTIIFINADKWHIFRVVSAKKRLERDRGILLLFIHSATAI